MYMYSILFIYLYHMIYTILYYTLITLYIYIFQTACYNILARHYRPSRLYYTSMYDSNIISYTL